jgi:hypothetical protein
MLGDTHPAACPISKIRLNNSSTRLRPIDLAAFNVLGHIIDRDCVGCQSFKHYVISAMIGPPELGSDYRPGRCTRRDGLPESEDSPSLLASASGGFHDSPKIGELMPVKLFKTSLNHSDSDFKSLSSLRINATKSIPIT